MREIAIGLVVTAALIGPPALAADMATKAPPVTPAVSTAASQNWYGFYIGAQAGYGWGVDPIDFAPSAAYAPAFAAGTLPPSLAADPRGALGGIQWGSNWQFGRYVLGTASDFSFSDVKASQSFFQALGPGINIAGSQKMTWFSTTRLRAGYTVTDNLLIYGTGGLADGRAEVSSSFLTPGCPGAGNCPAGTASKVLWGWAAGGGMEYAVGHWSANLEYLHYDLGNLNYNMTDPTTTAFIGASTKFSGDIVRGGVNYRFDWTPWEFIFGHHS